MVSLVWVAVRPSMSSRPTVTGTCSASPTMQPTTMRRCGRGCEASGADVARFALRGTGGHHPARGGPAGRSLARHAERGDHAGPVQDLLPGRDRRGLRADRLPALQCPLRTAVAGGPAEVVARRVEPVRPPPARGLRGRDHPVQLHRDRGQPAHRAGADGQHGGVEAVGDPAVRRRTSRCACWRRPACPPGVINLVTGDGAAVSDGRADRPGLRGAALHRLDARRSSTCGARWRRTSTATGRTRASSARPAARTSSSPTRAPTWTRCTPRSIRGAFEYQGQKCSAASRAYVPRSLWDGGLRDRLAATADSLTYGDVDGLRNFGGAVIDRRAFDKHAAALDRFKNSPILHRTGRRHLLTTPRATSSGRRWSSAPTRPTRCSPRSTSDRSSACTCTRTRTSRHDVRQAERASPYAPDRRDLRHRPAGRRLGRRRAAVRGRQLLHQRQAHRCGGRPAAVRRCAGQRHQRQGRLVAQPDPVDVAAGHQGDVRPADRPPYPHMG